MTTIDHDAVIDAIARCFPDGFDYGSMLEAEDQWLRRLCAEFGPPPSDLPIEHRVGCDDVDVFDEDAHCSRVTQAINNLFIDGRLRRLQGGELALSWSEQSRRIIDALGLADRPSAELMRMTVENVLSGKHEKRDV